MYIWIECGCSGQSCCSWDSWAHFIVLRHPSANLSLPSAQEKEKVVEKLLIWLNTENELEVLFICGKSKLWVFEHQDGNKCKCCIHLRGYILNYTLDYFTINRLIMKKNSECRWFSYRAALCIVSAWISQCAHVQWQYGVMGWHMNSVPHMLFHSL